MAEILLIYSTTDGHTLKISQRIKQTIEKEGHQVRLCSIDDAKSTDCTPYDKIIIGASIRYGKHAPGVYEFISSNERLLDSKPNAFFSVSLVARKAGKDQPETNPYLKKFLTQITWRPRELAVFAGKLDYPKYRLMDRMMIRLIMWMTKGPTDPETVVEFTDWEQVDKFALHACKMQPAQGPGA